MRTLIAVMATVAVVCIAARHQDGSKVEALEKRVSALEARVAAIEKKGKSPDDEKAESVLIWMKPIVTGLKFYKLQNGAYPTTEQGLAALTEKPANAPDSWTQILRSVTNDPWDRPFVYKCPGVKNPDGYDLFSKGADGKENTADDVWPEKK